MLKMKMFPFLISSFLSHTEINFVIFYFSDADQRYKKVLSFPFLSLSVYVPQVK